MAATYSHRLDANGEAKKVTEPKYYWLITAARNRQRFGISLFGRGFIAAQESVSVHILNFAEPRERIFFIIRFKSLRTTWCEPERAKIAMVGKPMAEIKNPCCLKEIPPADVPIKTNRQFETS